MKKKHIFLLIILLLCIFYLYLNQDKSSDKLIYIKNFLDPEDFNIILQLDTNKNNFKNENFRYIKPLNDQKINDIFYSEKYILKLKNLLQNDNIYESDFPIEHRIYPVGSKGMRWHSDTLLYEEPQYEGVFTIRNQSDSVTQWIDEIGKKHSVWTEPNSMLIVKAHGYKHHVTPVLTGEREIIKLIYTQSDNINDNYRREMKRFENMNINR